MLGSWGLYVWPASIQNSERQDDTRRISAVLSGERRCVSCSERSNMLTTEHALIYEAFLDLPDLFFNFAGPVFGFAFSL